MPSDLTVIRTKNASGADLGRGRFGLLNAQATLCHLLRLQRRVAVSEPAILRIPDWAIDWPSFPPPSCSLPGAGIGQLADFRYTIRNGTGLHLQRFRVNGRLVIDAHLDTRDGCILPIEHAVQATRAVEYGAVSAVTASLLAYVLTGSSKAAIGTAMLGAGSGALAGAHTPKQRRVVFELATLSTGSKDARSRHGVRTHGAR